MDINLKPEERHRMFSERMTFWNMFQYKEMLEEYAVDNKEARMLIEIESAIDETEEDVESEIEDDEDDEEEEEDEDHSHSESKELSRFRSLLISKEDQSPPIMDSNDSISQP